LSGKKQQVIGKINISSPASPTSHFPYFPYFPYFPLPLPPPSPVPQCGKIINELLPVNTLMLKKGKFHVELI
jgi:hypothetical protein